jgi:hypothetical protein
MPPAPETVQWWRTESGQVYFFVLLFLFVNGLGGLIGAVASEVRNADRTERTRRTLIYVLIALNFFAGPIYYFGYAVWKHDDRDT